MLYVRVLCFGENAIANVRAGSMFPMYVSGYVMGIRAILWRERGLDEEIVTKSHSQQLRTI